MCLVFIVKGRLHLIIEPLEYDRLVLYEHVDLPHCVVNCLISELLRKHAFLDAVRCSHQIRASWIAATQAAYFLDDLVHSFNVRVGVPGAQVLLHLDFDFLFRFLALGALWCHIVRFSDTDVGLTVLAPQVQA